MSLKTQAKVLRVLQEQVIEPVGGTTAHPRRRARARRDQQGPAGGDPRRAASARTSTSASTSIPIFVPPLRERREDIPLLAEHFLAMLRARVRPPRRRRSTPRRVARAAALPLAGQRARAAQRRRAADDHGARRRDHRARSRVPRRRAGAAPTRRRRAADGHGAAARRARSVRARLHPARAGGAARATCRAPPKCSASSAAISIGRCAGSGSRRGGAKQKLKVESR